MPFTYGEKIIIKYYRVDKQYTATDLLKEFPGKNWSKGGFDKLLRKIDKTGSVERTAGSGRPASSRNDENIEAVDELAFTQEDEEPS